MSKTRGYGALSRGRVSLPNARYFLTCCTRDRGAGLADGAIAPALRAEWTALERDGHCTVQAGVVMPDHLHVLICCTGTMALDRIVARFKARTRGILLQFELGWQGNFFDHRLRPDEGVPQVIRYLYLNPYRAGLLDVSEQWPWFWIGKDEAAWFEPTLDDGRPFPEWLGT